MTAQFLVSMLVIWTVIPVMQLACAYLILLERKVAAWSQDRIGPNRNGFNFGLQDLWNTLRLRFMITFRFWGLGQALLDGAKLFFKEDYTPPHVDKKLFYLAPALVMIPALLGWAVIPLGGYFYFPELDLSWLGLGVIEAALVQVTAAPVNIGVVYILAFGSLAVYGVTLGGYASNNKYSFLGSLRATAQMLSYEIPMGISVLVVILTFATLSADEMVNLQAMHGGVWGLLLHPLLAVIFFTCTLAEANRAPFDLAEAEQELVGGFHTESAALKWALFFLAEYMHMITGAAFFTILFLGGWSLNPFGLGPDMPLVAGAAGGEGGLMSLLLGLLIVSAKFAVFAIKVALMIFVMMWVRWTLPRFRFDQLMKLAWGLLIPMTLVVLLLSGLVVYLGLPQWTHLLVNAVVLVLGIAVSPLVPGAKVTNRKLELEGSRFSGPKAAEA